MVGLVIVAFFFLMAMLAGVLAPGGYDYSVLTETLQFPSIRASARHRHDGPGPTERIMYGARTSLLVGFGVEIFAFGIGMPMGALAGCVAAASIGLSCASWRS